MSQVVNDIDSETAGRPSPGRRAIASATGRPALVAVVALALLAFLVAAGVVVFGERERVAVVDLGGPLVYQPIADVLSDLRPSARRAHHIRLGIVVQLPQQFAPLLTTHEVAIASRLQERLRELTPQEVAGAAGSEHLRLQVLGVVNRTIAPASARTVLFTQLIVD